MENKETNIKDIYNSVNKLIKDEKIKFKFYNSYDKLEVLQICQNIADNTIEVNFRNTHKEYVSKLKDLLTKIETQ